MTSESTLVVVIKAFLAGADFAKMAELESRWGASGDKGKSFE